MRLNEFGRIVEFTWHDLGNHVAGLVLDAFVIMPNHVCGIVIVTNNTVGSGLGEKIVGAGSNEIVGAGSDGKIVGAGSEPAPTIKPKRHGLPEIVRQFKTFSARRIDEHRGTPGAPVWQRNYCEHILRNERELERIRQYIPENPVRWAQDWGKVQM